MDEKSIVLVAEDDYNVDEVDSVYDALSNIYPHDQWRLGVPNSGKVVVGFVNLGLRAAVARYGVFSPKGMITELLGTVSPLY